MITYNTPFENGSAVCPQQFFMNRPEPTDQASIIDAALLLNRQANALCTMLGINGGESSTFMANHQHVVHAVDAVSGILEQMEAVLSHTGQAQRSTDTHQHSQSVRAEQCENISQANINRPNSSNQVIDMSGLENTTDEALRVSRTLSDLYNNTGTHDTIDHKHVKLLAEELYSESGKVKCALTIHQRRYGVGGTDGSHCPDDLLFSEPPIQRGLCIDMADWLIGRAAEMAHIIVVSMAVPQPVIRREAVHECATVADASLRQLAELIANVKGQQLADQQQTAP